MKNERKYIDLLKSIDGKRWIRQEFSSKSELYRFRQAKRMTKK
jgi:hypothetical protein